MDKAKDVVCEAKTKIHRMLQNGFDMKHIYELADMIHSVKTIEEYLCEICEDHDSGVNEVDWLVRRIESELDAAQVYADKWLASQKPEYKQMAVEELQHAEIIIKQAQQEKIPQAKIHAGLERYNKLAEKLIK